MQEPIESKRNWFLDIPSEIIERIFVECLPTTTDEPWITLNHQWAPVLLMHVCSSWRKIALDCWTLWQSISFQHLEHHRSPASVSVTGFMMIQSQIMEQISLWRTARKGSQISLSVILESPIYLYQIIKRPDPPPLVKPNWPEHIKATVVDHIEMVHKLRLDCRFVDSSPFFRVPSDQMNNLKCLELVVPSFHIISTAFNLRRAPNLERFKLTVAHVDDEISSFPYWPQLTHLILTRNECVPIRSILQNCPNLQQLSMVVENDHASLDSGLITAQHLIYLSIRFDFRSDPSFFKDIYFPALIHLRIHCGLGSRFASFAWNIFDQSPLNVHFVSQLHKLQTLILAYNDMDGDALLELLRLTPNLLKLVIDSDLKTYRSFLTSLVYSPEKEGGQLLPLLKDFTICIDTCYASRHAEFVDEAKGLGQTLFQMAISRAGSTYTPSESSWRLRKVLLCYEEYQHFTDIMTTFTSMFPAEVLALKDLDFRVEKYSGGQRDKWAGDEIEFW